MLDFTDPIAPFKLAARAHIWNYSRWKLRNPLLINNKIEYWDMTPNEMINFLYNHNL